MKLRLGTRGSALAVTQSELVADALRRRGHEVELVRIKTGGDVAQGSLARLGGVGVFAAELRVALLDGVCDFAVHSLKDLPTAPIDGLTIAAVPEREDARDALCARDEMTLSELPAGASVGTGSPRRVAQLRALRPDLRFVDVRGNVGTRLARVADGDLDAVILAAAGLKRLGLADRITDVLPILPAPGQGALALECREDRADVIDALRPLDHDPTRQAVEAERLVLAGLGGGCAAPIAAWGRDGTLEAGAFAVDGSTAVRTQIPLGEYAADTAVQELMRHGAADVADLTATRPSRLEELHDDSSLWRGEAILAGVRVLLPKADGALAAGIRAAGAEVVAVPLTEKVPVRPAGELDGAAWVALTSPTTVEMLATLGLTIPEGAKVAAVGRATAEAARAAGIAVDLTPTGESSAAALAAAFPDGEGRVAIPGSARSSTVLADGLRAKGYAVDQFAIYDVHPVAEVPGSVAVEHAAGQFDVVAITAGSVAQAVDLHLGWPQSTAVVAFGPPSAAALERLGVEVAGVAATQDAEGLIRAIAALGTERS